MPTVGGVAREEGSGTIHDVAIHHAGAQVQQRDHLARRRLVVVLVAVLQREGINVHNSRSSSCHREYVGVVENLVLLDGDEKNVHLRTACVFGENLVVEIHVG